MVVYYSIRNVQSQRIHIKHFRVMNNQCQIKFSKLYDYITIRTFESTIKGGYIYMGYLVKHTYSYSTVNTWNSVRDVLGSRCQTWVDLGVSISYWEVKLRPFEFIFKIIIVG